MSPFRVTEVPRPVQDARASLATPHTGVGPLPGVSGAPPRGGAATDQWDVHRGHPGGDGPAGAAGAPAVRVSSKSSKIASRYGPKAH